MMWIEGSMNIFIHVSTFDAFNVKEIYTQLQNI